MNLSLKNQQLKVDFTYSGSSLTSSSFFWSIKEKCWNNNYVGVILLLNFKVKIKIPCTLMQWTRFSSWTRFWNLESEVTMTRLLIQREMRSQLCFPVIDSVTITRPGTSEPWRKFLEANIFGKFEANPFHCKNSRTWLERRSLLYFAINSEAKESGRQFNESHEFLNTILWGFHKCQNWSNWLWNKHSLTSWFLFLRLWFILYFMSGSISKSKLDCKFDQYIWHSAKRSFTLWGWMSPLKKFE